MPKGKSGANNRSGNGRNQSESPRNQSGNGRNQSSGAARTSAFGLNAQRTAARTYAANQPTYQKLEDRATQNAGSNGGNRQLGMGIAKELGIDPKLVYDFARTKGYGVGEKLLSQSQSEGWDYNSSPLNLNAPPTPGSRQAVTADKVIGKRELNKYAKSNDLSIGKAFNRLGNTGSAFSKGAMNRFSKQFQKENGFLTLLGNSPFASALGGGKQRQLSAYNDWSKMKGDWNPGQVFMPGQGGASRFEMASNMWNSPGSTYKGLQGMPSISTTADYNTDGTLLNTDAPATGPVESSQTLPETTSTPSSAVSGIGDDVASYASFWKGARSKRNQAGSAAQGYGSQKINPTNALGVGLRTY